MNGYTFGDFNRSFAQFIQWNNPDDNWPIVVTDVNCFNGTHVPPRIPDAQLGGSGILADQETIVFAGTNNSFDVQSIDTYKNPRQDGGDGISATLISGPANNQLQLSFTDDNNGFYTGTFNGTTVGTYVLSINNGTDGIQRDPFQFEVVPGNITCQYSQVSPTPLVTTTTTIGAPLNFSVAGSDAYGNRVISGGDSSFFLFSWNLNGFNVFVPVQITDFCNGSYYFNYSLSEPGIWSLLVVGTDGCLLINTTITVFPTLCPNNCSGNGTCNRGQCQCFPCFVGYDCAVDVLTSIALGPGLGDLVTDGTAASETYFFIETFDSFGSLIYRANITFNVLLTDLFGQTIPLDYQVFDLGNGIYNVTYIPDAAGTFLLYVQSGGGGCNIVGSPFTVDWFTNNPNCSQCCNTSVCILDPNVVSCLCNPGYTGFNCCIPLLQPGVIRFTDLGTAIIVPWTLPTNQANLYGEFDCSLLFYNTSYFGAGAFCDWPTPDQLRIWLGTSATVEVGNYLNFIPGLIGVQNNPSITYPQTGLGVFNSTIITFATNPVTPVALITAPYQTSTCATLILDGSYSTGTGGRTMFYQWRAISGPNFNLVTLYLQSLQQSSRLIIPSSEVNSRFIGGYTYTFQLVVSNHFGRYSAPALWSIFFSNEFIPTITISPSYLDNFRVYTEAKLVASAMTSGCASPYIGRNDHFVYTWIQEDGPTRQVDLDTTNTQNAFIPAGLFQAGQNFTWQVRIAHSTFPSLISIANTQINVISSQPFVRILGGYTRSFPLLPDNSLPLQIQTESIDYDNLPSNFTFTWTCYNLEFNEPCFDNDTYNAYFNSTAANVTIPTSEISIGQFLISVTIQKPGGRASTATQRITTIGNGPAIAASVVGLKNNFNIVNRNDPVHLSSGVNYGSSNPRDQFTNFNWTVLTGPNLNLPGVTSSSSTYLPDLVIPENVLGANQSFIFLVSGNNSLGTGFSTVQFQVDSRPVGGICQVRVNDSSISKVPSGADQAYYDVFTVFCNFWEDEVEESPVQYRYFLVTPTGGLFLLNTGKYTANRVDFTLPPGNNLIVVEIANYRGDVSYVEVPIRTVLDPLLSQLYPDELAEWLYLSTVTESIAASDEVRLGQSIYYTSRALNGNGNYLSSSLYSLSTQYLFNQSVTLLNTTTQITGTAKRQTTPGTTTGTTDQSEDINRRSFWYNYLVQNLVYDYQVESDIAGLTQKLQTVVYLLNTSSEVPDNALALLGNYTFNLLLLSETTARSFSNSVNNEFVNAAITAINYITTAVNTPTINGTRSTTAILQVSQAALNASQYLFTGILNDVIPGDAPTVLDTPQNNPDVSFGGEYLANVPIPYVISQGGVVWSLPLEYLRALANFLGLVPTQSFRYGLINYFNSGRSVFSLSPNSSFINTPITQLNIYSTNGTDSIYIPQYTTVTLPHNVSLSNNGIVVNPQNSNNFPIPGPTPTTNFTTTNPNLNLNLNPNPNTNTNTNNNNNNNKRQYIPGPIAGYSTPEFRASCLTFDGGVFTDLNGICQAIETTSSYVTCRCLGNPIVGAFVYLFTVPAGINTPPAPLTRIVDNDSSSDYLAPWLAVLLIGVVVAAFLIALVGLLVLLFKKIRRNHPEEHVVIYSRWEKEAEWEYQRGGAGGIAPEEEDEVLSESEVEEILEEEEMEEEEEEDYPLRNNANSRLTRMAGDKIGRGMRGTVGTRRGLVNLEITPGEREDEDVVSEKEALSPRGAMRTTGATSSATTRGVL